MIKSIVSEERLALCDLLESLDPYHPTLCDGWTVSHLVAHLVIRERRPIAALGLIIPGRLVNRLAKLTSRWASEIPFHQLIEKVRNGPPAPLRLIDGPMNLIEYFVHHEDVRRAVEGWSARDNVIDLNNLLWERQEKMARLLTRRLNNLDLTLERPTGESIRIGSGHRPATLIGEPGELVLYLFGRRQHSQVRLSGDPEAVHEVQTGRLGG